jgi:diguanylate cyclase (GGDEF)-like protein
MKNSAGSDSASRIQRWSQPLIAIGRWLVEPSTSIIGPEHRRQARLLMALLLILLLFALLGLISPLLGLYSVPELENSGYTWITLGVLALLVAEYALSRTLYYLWAAILVVVTILGGTFLIMITDPGNDQMPSFLILGGLIGSLFFSARSTAFIFLAAFVGLLLLPAIAPDISSADNSDTLFFLLLIGGLVVMATAIRQRYLEQIEWQTQQLIESEARLRELAIRDPLTGLFNRRYLEEMLAIEMIRARRKNYQIGVIMADIDHFKQFNDVHGHAAGDVVLVQIANLLRTLVRSSDVTCRYGGEEFIIILPEASMDITRLRADLMRESAGKLHIQYEGQTLKAVTLSLGVAIFPDHGSTMDVLLAAADTALYRAKRSGRNRVVAVE